MLESAREAGIPVALVGDESALDAPCDALFINDYARMGSLAGGYFIRQAGWGNRLLEVQGIPRSQEARALQAGLRQGIQGKGQVVCTVAGYHSRPVAGQRIQDSAPATRPFGINAVFAHDADMAYGALDALADMPVICVQYGEAASSLPFEAVVAASVGGREALDCILELLQGHVSEVTPVYLPVRLQVLEETVE